MDIALTRDVSPDLQRCLLTFQPRVPIDVEQAVRQHDAYVRVLESLGLKVLRLPADPALPDCCFVEDAAVVLDEVAVLMRMGATSRRGESAAIADALASYRTLVAIEAPATIDGGDVLAMGRRLFVGLSSRTNAAGVEALAKAVRELGYVVTPVRVTGSLHLKSAVTAVGMGAVLANPGWVDLTPFAGLEVIAVAPDEPSAANVLRVGEAVVAASAFPRTADRLRARGLEVVTVEVSEFLKAEAGVTCKALLFRRRSVSAPQYDTASTVRPREGTPP